jgi:hypothetical protein
MKRIHPTLSLLSHPTHLRVDFTPLYGIVVEHRTLPTQNRRSCMNRSLLSLSLSAVCFTLLFSGCQKAADSQSASSGQSAADATSSGASADAKSSGSRSASRQPEALKLMVVPAETVISVVLDQAVGSKISTPGQAFSATVRTPIESEDGRVAIPKGARSSGIVKDAKPAGRFKGGAILSLTLTSVTVGNEDYNIGTTSPTESSKGKGKRTAEMVGGGGAGGALIGGLAGGGKGALIGGLIGAAAGTGGAGLTGNRDIKLAAETPLTFKLVEPLEIKPRK